MTPAFLKTTARAARFVAVAVPVATALAVASPASAAIDPGVNYDPGSPAGKEYAIPLVLGRAEGAGTEDQRAAANTPFGVGITPPGGGSGGNRGSGKDGSGASGKRAGEGSAGAGGQGGLTVTRAEREAISRAEEPVGSGWWTLGIWLALLVPAAAIAAGLRGGRSPAAS
jgi:hypothetical protein